MNKKINKIKNIISNMQNKVVKVTKDYYVLDNGDIYEHTFEIDDNITTDEFQKMLDSAKETILSTLNKIEKRE